MDAFESLIATLLRRQGYWVETSFKVELTKAEKRKIGRPSSPRWELDLVAYKGDANEILAVECKSFLDSPGVKIRDNEFYPSKRYKLFTDVVLRRMVLRRLAHQLIERGSCRKDPAITLCLAAGNIANQASRDWITKRFRKMSWRLFDPAWIREELVTASSSSYENEVSLVVAKILTRNGGGQEVD